MNPFAVAAYGKPQEDDADRRARAPCIVDHLPDLIGPVSQLSPSKRAFLEEYIAEGIIDCVKRDNEFYVSRSDLDSYTIGDDADEE